MGIPVLLIEPDQSLGNELKEVLQREGFDADLRGDVRQGVIEFKKNKHPMVYMGLSGSAGDEIQALRDLKEINQNVCVVVGATLPGVELTPELSRIGVYSILQKPFQTKVLSTLLQKAHRNRYPDNFPEILLKQIGQAIRRLRHEKGLTLREVGSRSDLSYSMISKVELGDCDPSVTTLLKIARALDTELSHFCPSPDPPIEKTTHPASDIV